MLITKDLLRAEKQELFYKEKVIEPNSRKITMNFSVYMRRIDPNSEIGFSYLTRIEDSVLWCYLLDTRLGKIFYKFVKFYCLHILIVLPAELNLVYYKIFVEYK